MTTDTNITQGFIEMVEAYKAKPQLEATIADLVEDCDYFARHYQSEQATSDSLRATIATLQAALKEAQQERDDAMFRNLELEELKDKIGGLLGQGLAMFKTPVVESAPIVTTQEPQVQEANQIVAAAAGPIMHQSEATPYVPTWDGPIDPIVVSPQPEPTPAEPPQPSLNPSEPDGWERGKPYSYKPWYMTDAEWVSRGGFGPAKDEPKPDSDCIF